jgi:hypothetical protein
MISGALLFAAFGLRLALGMAASLFLLPRHEVQPRFYRTHFLTILGLLTVSALLVWAQVELAVRVAFGAAIVLAYVSSVLWTVEGAPGGQIVILLSTAVLLYLTAALLPEPGLLALADAWSSSAVLGLAMSAMLMGHSYLIAPGMSMTPLNRLVIALFVAVAVRMLLAGLGLWTLERPLASLPMDVLLWLVVRWLAGFIGLLAMAWLAWRCARIRSTQSATGILYVVVIFAFMGELISQLLRQTGYPG